MCWVIRHCRAILSPLFPTDFPVTQCANIKHWGPQPKPTLIPHAQTRPKTDFTGLCLTKPTLEGTRLFVEHICAWTWARHGCWVRAAVHPRVQGRNERENEKVICPSSHAHTHEHTDSPCSHRSCRQPSSPRWRLSSERVIITSTKRLSHGLRNVITWSLSTIHSPPPEKPTAETQQWCLHRLVLHVWLMIDNDAL